MGKDLAALYPVAQETFDEADAALGYKLSQLCFEGPEEQLRLTEITQPAILTASVAAFRVLISKGLVPMFVAGHSLGEYSAHVAAGTLDFADAVRTVRNRGKYMQEAVPVGEGAMAAILGMKLDVVREVCNESAQGQVCEPANINSPDQIVISGSKAAVERAAELARTEGRETRGHSPSQCTLPLRTDEASAGSPGARSTSARLPRHGVHKLITNVDAEIIDSPEQARDALIRQVTGAVQWEASMRKLIGAGVTTFVEVGPGKVLCGLMRQIDRSKKCLNVEDETSLQKTLEFFSGASAAS